MEPTKIVLLIVAIIAAVLLLIVLLSLAYYRRWIPKFVQDLLGNVPGVIGMLLALALLIVTIVALIPNPSPTPPPPPPKTQSPPPQKTQFKVPLEIGVNVIGQRNLGGGNYEEVFVKNGVVLKSDDNLRIYVRPTTDCYLYVLVFDSMNVASRLFPSPMAGLNNKVPGGRDYQIPDGGKWFFLDNNTGTETIYVLASTNPMSDIDKLVASMETKGKRNRQEDSHEILDKVNILKRGIGGTRPGAVRHYRTEDGDNISSVTQIVQGWGSVVWSVSFKHI
jgi:hypothetical protein